LTVGLAEPDAPAAAVLGAAGCARTATSGTIRTAGTAVIVSRRAKDERRAFSMTISVA
jgi:hypothetical protein